MLKKLSLTAIAAASLCASPAAAASSTGDFAAKGPGRAPCSEFMDAKKTNRPEYRQYLAFFEGFLTAANRYEPETFDLAPWHNAAAIGMIVEQYCKANTSDSLAVVGTRLAEAFKPIRLAATSPMVEVGEGANRAVLYEQILKRAQTQLKVMGLYAGQTDGKFNPETSTALQNFQTQKQMAVTGVPDPVTLWFLLNP